MGLAWGFLILTSRGGNRQQGNGVAGKGNVGLMCARECVMGKRKRSASGMFLAVLTLTEQVGLRLWKGEDPGETQLPF